MDKRRKELILIAVGALVVLIALYLTFRPRTQPASAQPPVAAAPAPQAPPASQAPQAQPAAQSAPAQEPVLVESGAATTDGRDPFRPIVVAKAPAAPPAAANPGAGALPPITIPGPWGDSPGLTAPVSAPEPLRLTGVVRGEPSIAVLRRGAKRYIVTIGDPVDNTYLVKSISDGRVVLASGEKTLSLTLGGRM